MLWQGWNNPLNSIPQLSSPKTDILFLYKIYVPFLYHCFLLIVLQNKLGRQKSLSAQFVQQDMACLLCLQAVPAIRLVPFLQRLRERREKFPLEIVYTSAIEVMGLSVFADG